MHAEFAEVQAGDFFVELLGQHAHGGASFSPALPEGDLRKHLICKAVAHHEGGVARGAAEVDETALRQQVEAVAVREGVLVDLRLDVRHLDPLPRLEPRHLDLVVEVADVADDGLILHALHVLQRDDVAVASRGDVDVAPAEGVLHGEHAVALHGGLQSANRVDLRDDHLRSEPAQSLGAALADVAVAADDGDLARDHDVRGALDAVRQALAAAVEVVELALGHRVVDVDGGDEQATVALHLVQAVDARRRLFRDAHELRHPAVEDAGPLGGDALQQGLDDALLLALRRGVHPRVARLHLIAAVHEEGGVAAVVHDELGTEAVLVAESLPGAVPVVLQRFALPGEDGDA